MFTKIRVRHIQLLVVILLFLVSYTSVLAQSPQKDVELIDIELIVNQLTLLEITGSVSNRLPWEIRDVEVILLIEDQGETIEKIITVQSVAPISTTDFETSQQIHDFLTATMRSGIRNFTINASTPEDLILRFILTDDGVTRAAIVDTFNVMPQSARAALNECLSNPPVIEEALFSDILCLNSVYLVGDSTSVPALITMATRYPDFMPFLSETLFDLSNADTIFSDLHIYDLGITENTTTTDLVHSILVGMGDDAILPLAEVALSDDPLTSLFAYEMLSRLAVLSAERILNLSDQESAQTLIPKMIEKQFPNSTIPILEYVVIHNQLQSSVELAFTQAESAQISDLVLALQHPQLEVADLALDILNNNADVWAASLEQIWRDQLQKLPPQNTALLIGGLRENADQIVQDQIDEMIEAGFSAFESGDCEVAADQIVQVLQTRNTVIESETPLEILLCQARNYADEGDYNVVLELAAHMFSLAPEDQALRDEITVWYVSAGDQASSSTEAFDHYMQALDLASDQLPIEKKLFDLSSQLNNLYRFLGAVIMVAIIAIATLRK